MIYLRLLLQQYIETVYLSPIYLWLKSAQMIKKTAVLQIMLLTAIWIIVLRIIVHNEY